jgi:hypothetical protein
LPVPRLADWRFEPRQQIASGFDGAVSVVIMAYALLLFIPLSRPAGSRR